MRSIIIDMILSTDMKNHAALLNSADTVLEEDTNVHGKAGMTGLLLELVIVCSHWPSSGGMCVLCFINWYRVLAGKRSHK